MNRLFPTPTQRLLRHASFLRLGYHNELIAWPWYEIISGNSVFSKNTTKHFPVQEPNEQDNLGTENLRFNLLS